MVTSQWDVTCLWNVIYSRTHGRRTKQRLQMSNYVEVTVLSTKNTYHYTIPSFSAITLEHVDKSDQMMICTTYF